MRRFLFDTQPSALNTQRHEVATDHHLHTALWEQGRKLVENTSHPFVANSPGTAL
jgi:hypothetical protein